jgi:hypothetical protein
MWWGSIRTSISVVRFKPWGKTENVRWYRKDHTRNFKLANNVEFTFVARPQLQSTRCVWNDGTVGCAIEQLHEALHVIKHDVQQVLRHFTVLTNILLEEAIVSICDKKGLWYGMRSEGLGWKNVHLQERLEESSWRTSHTTHQNYL